MTLSIPLTQLPQPSHQSIFDRKDDLTSGWGHEITDNEMVVALLPPGYRDGLFNSELIECQPEKIVFYLPVPGWRTY